MVTTQEASPRRTPLESLCSLLRGHPRPNRLSGSWCLSAHRRLRQYRQRTDSAVAADRVTIRVAPPQTGRFATPSRQLLLLKQDPGHLLVAQKRPWVSRKRDRCEGPRGPQIATSPIGDSVLMSRIAATSWPEWSAASWVSDMDHHPRFHAVPPPGLRGECQPPVRGVRVLNTVGAREQRGRAALSTLFDARGAAQRRRRIRQRQHPALPSAGLAVQRGRVVA